MNNFSKTYYKETSESNGSGVVIVEITSKALGAKVLKTLGNIFGKKSENVDVTDLNYDEVTKTSFGQFASKISNNFLSTHKKDNLTYVKRMYNANLQNPEKLNPDVSRVNSSVVFELNNGGKLYLISLQNKDNISFNYIGTNNQNKVNDFFIEHFGRPFSLYMLTKKAIRQKQKSGKKSKDDLLNPISLSNKLTPVVEPEIDSDNKEDDVVSKDKFPLVGIIDTDVETFNQLVDKWGNGAVGDGIFKNTYKYKGIVKRLPFENDWGRGYKYTLGAGIELYLLQSNDNKFASKILFNNKRAYSRAQTLDMLPWFNPGTKIQWENLDINNF